MTLIQGHIQDCSENNTVIVVEVKKSIRSGGYAVMFAIWNLICWIFLLMIKKIKINYKNRRENNWKLKKLKILSTQYALPH